MDVSKNFGFRMIQLRKVCNHPYLFTPKLDGIGESAYTVVNNSVPCVLACCLYQSNILNSTHTHTLHVYHLMPSCR